MPFIQSNESSLFVDGTELYFAATLETQCTSVNPHAREEELHF